MTGVSWEEYYGTFAYYGAGLDYAVMAGVMVMTGATLNQWSGPIWGVSQSVGFNHRLGFVCGCVGVRACVGVRVRVCACVRACVTAAPLS